jgi:tetratricopeptide (TPR) repeat protein
MADTEWPAATGTATAVPADRYGQVVSTRSAEAATSYYDAVDRCLALDATAVEAFRAALAADPDLAVAYAGLGVSLASDGRDDEARAAFGDARRLLHAGSDRLTSRERRQIELVTSPPEYLAAFDEHLEAYPGDLLVLSVAAGLLSGRRVAAGTGRDGLLGLARRCVAAFPGDWALEGIRAMELEEAWSFDAAEAAAQLALRARPDNRAACHGYVHVLHETGRLVALEAFLADWFDRVDDQSPLQTHLHWHDVMIAVEQDDVEGVLRRYEATVSPGVSSRRTTLVDSAAVLWRLRVDGVDDLPWSPVVGLARALLGRLGTALFDVHAALALAVGDRPGLEALRTAWKQDHRRPHRGVVCALLDGIAAYVEGRFDVAAESIGAVTAALVVMGGSRLQQDVMVDTLCDALARSGEPGRAAEVLRDRQRRRGSVRDARWIAQLTSASPAEEAGAGRRGGVVPVTQ